jgi:hypothetical protein
MVFVVIVAGMGVCMIQLHTGQTRRQEQMIDNKRALYIAEAGLAEAFMSVALGKSGNVGAPEIPARFGDGLYWVEATDQGGGQVGLISTGLCGKGRFSASAVLQRQVDQIASLGFYSVDGITVGQGVLIDGYDSSVGDYTSQVDASMGDGTTGKGALLTSGSDIVLSGGGASGALSRGGSAPSGTTVYGDVRPGPSGVTSVGRGVTVTGSTTPVTAEAGLPEIAVPSLRTMAPLSFRSRSARVTEGEYEFDSISVPAGGTLTLTGPLTLVANQLTVADGATLSIDSSAGQVVTYITERLVLEEGSTVSSTEADPTGFVLMLAADQWQDFDRDGIADDPVEFSPRGDFHGYVYAPTVDLAIGDDTHLFGGVATRSLLLREHSRVTFDLALISSEVASSGLPLLVAWRIADLPDEPILSHAINPEKYLEESGVIPVPSDDAHLDDYVSLDYFDSNGVAKAYSGPEKSFDWAKVEILSGVVWDDDAEIGDEGQKVHKIRALSGKAKFRGEGSGKGRHKPGWGKARPQRKAKDRAKWDKAGSRREALGRRTGRENRDS